MHQNGTASQLSLVAVFDITFYTLIGLIIFVLLVGFFALRKYKERKRARFYKVRKPKVAQRKVVVFRTRKYNYGRDNYGRWRKWLRPNRVMYRPYNYSVHPQLAGRSLEEIESQPFVPSTLRVNPDFLHEDYVRMACSHTTFEPIRGAAFVDDPPSVREYTYFGCLAEDVPIRKAPFSVSTQRKKRRCEPQSNNQGSTYHDYLDVDDSQTDDE